MNERKIPFLPGSEITTSFEQFQSMEMDQIQQWEMSPFLMMEGNEELENMREVTEKGPRDLEYRYKQLRKRILTPPYKKVVTEVTGGRNSAAKGGLNRGLSRLLRHDPYLKQELAQRGIELQTKAVLFAACAEAAKLPSLGLVDPSLQHGQFSEEDYRAISRLQWEITQQEVLENQDDNTATVLLYESPMLTAFPVSKSVPVEVEGVDRGSSAAYNLAFDERTKANVHFNLIDRDVRVGDKGFETRKKINPYGSKEEVDEFFNGDMRFVYTPRSGREHDASDLDELEQRMLLLVLQKFSATPSAMVRGDQEVDAILEQLVQERKIKEARDRNYFNMLRRRLELPASKFSIIENELLGGTKTYDVTYLLDENVVYNLYPEILNFSPLIEWYKGRDTVSDESSEQV